MKKLLLTTSLVLCTSLSAYAETTAETGTPSATTGAVMPSYMAGDMAISAETLIGKRVYIGRDAAAQMDETWSTDGMADASDDWDDAGEVGDILVSADGAVNSVIVDAGGFLGMGEREVQVNMEDLQFVRDNDNEGEYFVVYTGDRTALEGVPAYDQSAAETGGLMLFDHNGMSDQATADGMSDPVAGTDAEMVTRPDRTAMQGVDEATLTSEELTGAAVYGSADNWVGEVGQLVLGDDGKISHVVIDVGGWLGMGEHPVALGFDQVEIVRGEDASEVIVYVDATEDQLEAMPAWEG